MKKFPPSFSLSVLALVYTLGIAPLALADSSSSSEGTIDACKAHINAKLGREERLYRSVIFGQQKSEDLPPGSVRFDREHDTWMKIKKNEWRSLDSGNLGLTWSDTMMDGEADVVERRGMLEIRSAMSSELIPPMLQAMRAMQCRMRAVCMTIDESRNPDNDGEDTVKIQPDGCIEFEMDIPKVCASSDIAAMQGSECDATVDLIIERESKMLELIVAYDAAYRSLLQFSGAFEGFLDDFRFPLLQPLWQMVRAFGALDDLPCFIAQCDE